MHVAILTVGDEILAGEITNTNASWLAARIGERGVTVDRILTVPDDRAVIADTVEEWHDAYDAVVTTGGLGGTPDDVTMEAVADALERDLVVDEGVLEQLQERARAYREERPDLFENDDFNLDLEATATLPEGATPIVTEAGWAPGCVVENVYVFAGFPEEMQAGFERIADHFDGDVITRSIYTPAPEGALTGLLGQFDGQFDATVGSYPRKGSDPGRLRVTGTDEAEVEAALDWFRERIETVPDPDRD